MVHALGHREMIVAMIAKMVECLERSRVVADENVLPFWAVVRL